MVDFSKLKSQKGSSLAKLTEKLDSMNTQSGGQKDERMFKPGFDKGATPPGYAVIRFLPAKEGEPFVKKISHSFQGQGGWYIETSRVTAGFEDDPVAVSNKLYWAKGEAEGNDAFKNVAKKRKRVTKYFANIYVEKDTINPANNGKVMIYEFGTQIFKAIEKAIKPEFEDDSPIDPFDMWTGASFRIKVIAKEIPDSRDPSKKVIVPSYEDSEFAKESEFFKGDDAKKEEIFNQTFDLSEFTKVKSFEELAKRFEKVTGEKHDALEAGDPSDKVVESLKQEVKQQEEQADAPEPKSEEPKEDVSESSEDEDDDVMAMFKNLASK